VVPKARAEDAIRSRAREDVFLSFEEDVSVEIWRERMAIAREFQKKKMFLLRSSTLHPLAPGLMRYISR